MILTVIVILGCIAIAIISFLNWSLKKKAGMIASAISATLFLIAFFVYRDATDLGKNLKTSSNLVLVEEHDQLLAGIAGAIDTTPAYVTDEQLQQISSQISAGAWNAVKQGHYKVFLFDVAAFTDLEHSIKFGDVNLTPGQAVRILRSQQAMDDFATIVLEQRPFANTVKAREVIMGRFASTAELKGKVLSAVMKLATTEYSTSFIPTTFRKGQLEVYKKTPYFTFVQFIPQFLMDAMVRAG